MGTSGSRQAKKGKSNLLGLLGILCVGAFFPPTTILLFSGLAPSYIAWLSDRTKGKLAFVTVVSFNLMSLIPLLLRLWDRGNTFSTSISMLLSPFTWILVLTGAGVGWVLVQTLPLMIAGVMTARDKAKLDRIRTRQKMLSDEWGQAVTEIPRGR